MGCCTSKNTKNLAIKPVQLSQSAFNLRLKLQGSDFIRYNTFDIKQIYKLGSRVGVGSFGEVRRCYHKLTGDLRAVKVYQKEMIN
mmetsp:Transcript_3145/g.423  ORF Transcript_3145/g.423 Transcript_3145/m.423 type:complete len:85 (-) Transcript_3145:82-336(-)